MNGRIMIVEDEGLVADDLSSCIQGFGYDVVGVASSVEAAEQLVDRVKPDLVLLDIQLRGERDGIDLAAELRKKQIGFVYLTAHSDRRTLDRAEVTEPLGYVLKPFGARDMLPVLKTALYRHAAEKNLRGMEAWLSTTLRSIGDGVLVTDRDGRVTYVNPEAERLLGRRCQDVVGSDSAEVLHLVAPDGSAMASNLATRAIELSANVRLEPGLDLVRPDGTRVAIDDCASPVCSDRGDVTGAVVVFRDDSERRLVEQRRFEADQRMHEAEKLESLSVVSSGLAHDLNNVLVSVLGSVALCRATQPQPAVLDSLQLIEKSARDASVLCHRMLNGAGANPLTLALVDLVAVVDECARRERTIAGDRVAIRTRFERPELFVSADEVQMQQVITNLLRNAVEAMRGAGGTVTVRGGTVTLPNEFARGQTGTDELPAGDYVWLEVADDGPGMPTNVKAKVFEPFFTTKTSGRGLGLANVASIVRRHDGVIACESEFGCGAVFRILLPGSVEANSVRARAVPRTALVVDDDRGVRVVTSRLLGTRNWACHEASNGDDAVRMLRDGLAVDAVVLDMMMPGTDGNHALTAIRALRPELPVVVVSGLEPREPALVSDPHTAFLMKPFVIDQLTTAIERLRRGSAR